MTLADDPKYDIRYANTLDGYRMKQWLEHERVRDYLPITEKNEIDMTVKHWLSFTRQYSCITATYDGIPVGFGILFLMPYKKTKHMAMFNFMVDPEYQGRGIGTSLLKNLMHLAKNTFHLETLFIDFYEGGPAYNILLKAGFKQIARQENFVKIRGKSCARLLLEVVL